MNKPTADYRLRNVGHAKARPHFYSSATYSTTKRPVTRYDLTNDSQLNSVWFILLGFGLPAFAWAAWIVCSVVHSVGTDPVIQEFITK